ncbi:MAG TPA: hypothetical protein VFL27_00395 [Candidatus Dormibacteraeota bacterium]|nr:hypothetical protein [Candidatus Dormibacteraeota bacterium]
MWIRVLVLSLLLFAGAFGTHEVMHLLVIYAVGGSGSIIERPWEMGLVNFSLPSLHAQPARPLDLTAQTMVNALGPLLAAVPLGALLWWVREPVPAAALIANVVILVFYAAIEAGDLILEQVYHMDVAWLTWPEFNYGVPLVVIGLTVLAVKLFASDGSTRIPD